MRISRIRPHEKTIEITVVIPKEECKNLTHFIECGARCAYPERREAGEKALRELDDIVLSHYWPVS